VNKLMSLSCFIASTCSLTLAQNTTGGGTATGVIPVPVMTFQESLWDDFWNDDFIEDVDGLISNDLISSSTHTAHRMEWDSTNPTLDISPDTAQLSQVSTWDMNWLGMEVDNTFATGTTNGSPWIWNAVTTVETRSFSSTISSTSGLSRHIYGIVRSIQIQWPAASGGDYAEFQIWMPLGRTKSLADAEAYAEGFAYSNVQPNPRTLEPDLCSTLLENRENQAWNLYSDEIDDCGTFGNVVGGVIGGAAGGGAAGAVVGGIGGSFFGGIGAVPGSGGGAIIFGAIGAVIGGLSSHANCNADAYDKYARKMAQLFDCWEECELFGDWYCD